MGMEMVLLAILGSSAAVGAVTLINDDASIDLNDAQSETDLDRPAGFAQAEISMDDTADTTTEEAAAPAPIWYGETLFVGHEGGDDATLDATNHLALGGNGDDVITAGQGDDRLLGESGNDMVYGGAGDDVLMDGVHDRTGLDQAELRLWINALSAVDADASDDDNLYGGSGDDVIEARYGSDISYGGEGDDLILALDHDQGGADGLFGGAGNDRLVGDSFDMMIGGDGADRFEADFSQNELELSHEGRVTILDFNAEEDQIILHDEHAVTPAFDLDADREQVVTPQSGHIVANEAGDYIHLDLIHHDGSISEMARLRFADLADVEAAIASGAISATAA